jgi:hypothetical protein
MTYQTQILINLYGFGILCVVTGLINNMLKRF